VKKWIMTYFKPFGIFWVKINEKIIKIEINMAKNKTEKLEHKEAPRFKETEIGLIPEDWDFKVFSDIVDIFGGGTPKTTVPEYWDGEIPWLSVVDFNNDFRTVYETEKKITNLGLENSSTKLLKKGDLIISARGTVGAIAQLGKSMAFNQSCYGLRAKNGFKNDFVYYLLKFSLNILKQTTHGSTFDTITRNTFDLLKIPIPTPKEQYNIANILSTIDDKIEINNQINKNLEHIVEIFFQENIINYWQNESPKDWKIANLSELITITSGKRPKIREEKENEEFSVPVIGASSIMAYTNEFIYNEPLILIGRVGTLGIVQRINFKSFPSDNTLVIKSKYYEYVFQILKKINYGMLNVGSTQPLITQTSIKDFEVIIPPENILTNFEEFSKTIYHEIYKNQIENKRLIELRDVLLLKLISGQIDVLNVKI
jgi:type I restriction enzyme S subunit